MDASTEMFLEKLFAFRERRALNDGFEALFANAFPPAIGLEQLISSKSNWRVIFKDKELVGTLTMLFSILESNYDQFIEDDKRDLHDALDQTLDHIIRIQNEVLRLRKRDIPQPAHHMITDHEFSILHDQKLQLDAQVESLEKQLSFVKESRRRHEVKAQDQTTKLVNQLSNLTALLEKAKEEKEQCQQAVHDKDRMLQTTLVHLHVAQEEIKNLSHEKAISRQKDQQNQHEIDEVLQKQSKYSAQNFTQVSQQLDAMRTALTREKQLRMQEHEKLIRENAQLTRKLKLSENFAANLNDRLLQATSTGLEAINSLTTGGAKDGGKGGKPKMYETDDEIVNVESSGKEQPSSSQQTARNNKKKTPSKSLTKSDVKKASQSDKDIDSDQASYASSCNSRSDSRSGRSTSRRQPRLYQPLANTDPIPTREYSHTGPIRSLRDKQTQHHLQEQQRKANQEQAVRARSLSPSATYRSNGNGNGHEHVSQRLVYSQSTSIFSTSRLCKDHDQQDAEEELSSIPRHTEGEGGGGSDSNEPFDNLSDDHHKQGEGQQGQREEVEAYLYDPHPSPSPPLRHSHQEVEVDCGTINRIHHASPDHHHHDRDHDHTPQPRRSHGQPVFMFTPTSPDAYQYPPPAATIDNINENGSISDGLMQSLPPKDYLTIHLTGEDTAATAVWEPLMHVKEMYNHLVEDFNTLLSIHRTAIIEHENIKSDFKEEIYENVGNNHALQVQIQGLLVENGHLYEAMARAQALTLTASHHQHDPPKLLEHEASVQADFQDVQQLEEYKQTVYELQQELLHLKHTPNVPVQAPDKIPEYTLHIDRNSVHDLSTLIQVLETHRKELIHISSDQITIHKTVIWDMIDAVHAIHQQTQHHVQALQRTNIHLEAEKESAEGQLTYLQSQLVDVQSQQQAELQQLQLQEQASHNPKYHPEIHVLQEQLQMTHRMLEDLRHSHVTSRHEDQSLLKQLLLAKDQTQSAAAAAGQPAVGHGQQQSGSAGGYQEDMLFISELKSKLDNLHDILVNDPQYRRYAHSIAGGESDVGSAGSIRSMPVNVADLASVSASDAGHRSRHDQQLRQQQEQLQRQQQRERDVEELLDHNHDPQQDRGDQQSEEEDEHEAHLLLDHHRNRHHHHHHHHNSDQVEDLLGRLELSEAKVIALSNQLDHMPPSLAVAQAERRVLEAKLRKAVAASEHNIEVIRQTATQRINEINAFLELERHEKEFLKEKLKEQNETVHQLTHHLKLLQAAVGTTSRGQQHQLGPLYSTQRLRAAVNASLDLDIDTGVPLPPWDPSAMPHSTYSTHTHNSHATKTPPRSMARQSRSPLGAGGGGSGSSIGGTVNKRSRAGSHRGGGGDGSESGYAHSLR